MERRVAAVLIFAALLASNAFGGLPKRAGIAYAWTEDWNRALAAIPADSRDGADLYYRGLALWNTGRVDEGLSVLAALSREKGGFAGAALEKIAEYAFSMGRYRYLTEAAGSAVGVKFSEPDAFYYRLGQSHFMLKNYPSAREFLTKVADHRYKRYALHSLGLISFSEGDPAGAITHLNGALLELQYVSDIPQRTAFADRIKVLEGRIYHHANLTTSGYKGNEKEVLFKEADRLLSSIKPDSPFYPDALRTLAWYSLEMNDTVRALALFELAMGVDPDNAHEDLWATGRVLERLGFFDEAADSYARAAKKARETAERLRTRQRPAAPPTPYMLSGELGKLSDRCAELEGIIARVEAERAKASEAASARETRLASVGAVLETIKGDIDGRAEEINRWIDRLYLYLDNMDILGLFPKSQRARVSAALDRRQRLESEVEKTAVAIQQLKAMRSWNLASGERRAMVDALWERLTKAGASMTRADLLFLESAKQRVSVTEKELAANLADKKAQNESLKELLSRAVSLLEGERGNLAKTVAGMREQERRLASVRTRLDGLKGELLKAMEAEEAMKLAARAQAIALRADQIALDEAQALYRLKNREAGDSDK